MAEVIWSKNAFNDIEDIHAYISLDSTLYADNMIETIYLRANELLFQPFIGRIVPEENNQSLREIFKGNYRIMYSTESLPDIIIYRIIHFAQNFHQ